MKRIINLLSLSLLMITSGAFLFTLFDARESSQTNYIPEAHAACDLAEFSQLELDFQAMVQQRQKNLAAVPDDVYRATALAYINQADTCYETIIEPQLQTQTEPVIIDDGGVWAPGYGPADDDLSGQYVTKGSKWGTPGLGNPGGTVTYSYIPQGVSHATEGLGGNTHISNLIGFSSCFYTEIDAAFAAWSAVADIDFVQVADNGYASNAYGAVGDIRIGAHDFDGDYGTLAHAYYPPPNSVSIAGDLHLDNAETWACNPYDGFDIGIITLHEIGHSLGLKHQTAPPIAIMNPVYNNSFNTLFTDDMEGIIAIYGIREMGINSAASPSPILATTNFITYTLRLQNNSSATLTNLQIANTIPSSTTYVSGTASNGGFESSPGVLAWPTTMLGGNGTLNRTFQVQVTQTITDGQKLVNTLNVTYDQGPAIQNKVLVSFVNPKIIYLPMILK